MSAGTRFIAIDKKKRNIFAYDVEEKQIYKIPLLNVKEKIPLLTDSARLQLPDPNNSHTKKHILDMIVPNKNNKIYILTVQNILIYSCSGEFEKKINLEGIRGFSATSIAVENNENIYVGGVTNDGSESVIRIDFVTERRSTVPIHGRVDRLFLSGCSEKEDGDLSYGSCVQSNDPGLQECCDLDQLLYAIDLAGMDGVTSTKINRISVIPRTRNYEAQGTYTSKRLDSLKPSQRWHKLVVDSEIPTNSSIKLSYYISDRDSFPTDDQWRSVPPNPVDVLINTPLDSNGGSEGGNEGNGISSLGNGRYLWFKIVMSNNRGNMNQTPRVKSIKAYYPRLSYLRYLPVTFQTDESSAKFLERFLSLFETFFMDVEDKIFSFTRYIDPRSAPNNFLPWLASWLAIGIDEAWPNDFIRRLIEQAPDIYKKRGTRGGIEKIITTYLDADASNIIIFESFQFDSVSHSNADYDYMGRFFCNNNPYAFCVLINSSIVDEYKLNVIRRIVENEKPTHTYGYVDVYEPWFYLGINSFLGINTRLTSDYKHQGFILGKSVIGKDTALSKFSEI